MRRCKPRAGTDLKTLRVPMEAERAGVSAAGNGQETDPPPQPLGPRSPLTCLRNPDLQSRNGTDLRVCVQKRVLSLTAAPW